MTANIVRAVSSLLLWLAGRPRLAVRILEDDVEKDVGGFIFEIENRSGSATSLLPTIESSFWYVLREPHRERIVKGTMRYAVRELDRQLEPYKARTLTATAEKHLGVHIFSWYRTYTFEPARGWCAKARVRNAFLERLSRWRFVAELIPFRLFGKLPNYRGVNGDDYKRMKRFQGPH